MMREVGGQVLDSSRSLGMTWQTSLGMTWVIAGPPDGEGKRGQLGWRC